MNDEILKYKQLLEKLKIINKKIQKLNIDILNLKNKTKDIIMIDNQIYNIDKFEKINEILVSSSKKINENVIPSIINKIYN